MLSICLFVIQADHIRNMQTNEIDMFTTFAENCCELHLFSPLSISAIIVHNYQPGQRTNLLPTHGKIKEEKTRAHSACASDAAEKTNERSNHHASEEHLTTYV